LNLEIVLIFDEECPISGHHRLLKHPPGYEKHSNCKASQGEKGDHDLRAAVDIMNAYGIKVLAHGEVAHPVDQMGERIELGEELYQRRKGVYGI